MPAAQRAPACPCTASQVDSFASPKYSGIIDCGRKIVASHGPSGLWKGFAPALARSFPANAACFAVYEASQKWMVESLGL
jgi:solute carrier family 25 carnitine/acylcarnitine transporter 20/29